MQLEGYTPDEVYTSLVDIIRKLEQRVFDQEYEVAYSTLDGLLDYMYDNAGTQFHIHPTKGIETDLASAPRLTVHPEYLKRIGYSLVPGIAAHMGHAAEDAQGADKPGVWSRTNYIGLSPDGPYPRWSEVLGEFDAVTTGSGKELVEAGRLLAVGAGFVEDTDGATQEMLKGVQDDLDRGSDEWDNEPPEYQYGVRRVRPALIPGAGERTGLRGCLPWPSSWGRAPGRCAGSASSSWPGSGPGRMRARSWRTSARTSYASTGRVVRRSPPDRTTSSPAAVRAWRSTSSTPTRWRPCCGWRRPPTSSSRDCGPASPNAWGSAPTSASPATHAWSTAG